MPVPDDVLDRARRLDPSAAEAVLADAYPSVRRIALALVGRPATAGRVVEEVLDRGLRVLPSWRAGATPENWFYHHTVLTAREAAAAAGEQPDPRQDPLVTAADAPAAADPAYVAFVRAVRGLPPQQAEAFLLNHGERLNERLLGVAMDCSARAAENHLRAAHDALSAVAGPDGERHTATLTRAYAALGPAPADVAGAVRPPVRRVVRARRFRRIVRALVTLFVLGLAAAGAYAAWHWRHVLPR